MRFEPQTNSAPTAYRHRNHPGWIEYGIGAARRPDRIHTGACKVTSRGRAATRDTILEVLRTVPSAIACPLCRPDSELGLLDS
ncbi:DUF6233 domain-containing protein [Streptomyces sp. NBC_01426]|uniref:DUF6233 domain-containing protein n=1 Tax=Streptomyces sp. NBC_01426 TaxID=2975866 RepID=UPI003FCD193F